MKREAQYKINCEARYIWSDIMKQFLDEAVSTSQRKLRTCNAVVHETSKYYILQSYSTPVAAIVKSSHVMIDMLRCTYGYTATSAQHIAKFKHDYTPYPWNYPVLTWRELK